MAKIERKIQQEKPAWRKRLGVGLMLPNAPEESLGSCGGCGHCSFLALAPSFFMKVPSSPDSSVVEYVESQNYNVMVYESEKENVTVIWLFEGPQKEVYPHLEKNFLFLLFCTLSIPPFHTDGLCPGTSPGQNH
jgi:hypothetical protein